MESKRSRKISRIAVPDVPGAGDRKRHRGGGARDNASVVSVGSSTWDGSSARNSRTQRHSRDQRRNTGNDDDDTAAAAAAAGNERRRAVAAAAAEMAVVHFVYSEAVEKAIRRGGYQTSAFPGVPRLRPENTFLVASVPDIVSDLVLTRNTRRRNLERERAYRKSLPDFSDRSAEDKQNNPRLRVKLASMVDRMRPNRNGPAGGKLPPLLLGRGNRLFQAAAAAAAANAAAAAAETSAKNQPASS